MTDTLDAEDRSDWHAWRRTGVGASDVAGIVGLSNWASPMSVWADKVGLSTDDRDSEEMEFGRRAEVMLGPWFTDRTGLHVVGEQTWCHNPTRPWMLCTVDGFVADDPGAPWDALLGVLEFKTSGPGEWDEIPEAYQVQVQWQLGVTDYERAWVGALHGRRFRVYELDRDAEVLARLIEIVGEFWFNYVLPGVPPPVDDHEATAAVLNRLWPGRGEAVALDHLAGVVAELRDVRVTAKEVEARKRLLENEIKAALGDATVGLVDGERAVTWKPSTSTRIDLDALRERHPRAVTRFETPTTSRRFLLKDAS